MDKKLRNFEQVKDVFDYGIALHAQLSALYTSLERQSGQARVRMALDYLGRHERNRRQAMERFEREPHVNGYLDVWLQYAPSPDIERLLAECVIRPDMSVDDVVGLAMRFDNALIELYREAAREAEDTQAREVFENLATMEQKEKERFVRDAEWLQDI